MSILFKYGTINLVLLYCYEYNYVLIFSIGVSPQPGQM